MSSSLFHRGKFTVNPKRCFVMMPFDPALRRVHDLVQRTIEEYCALECIRADEIATSHRITGDIWTHINESRILIADLTDRNPNVFYELGLAHACDRPVILLTQNEDHVPFDLREIRYIKYDYANLEALSGVLTEYIRNYISTIPPRWNRNYCPSNWDGPYVKIRSLEAPSRIQLDEPFEIVLRARNNGKAAANQGYFSVSFPNGARNLKLDTNADRNLGTKIGTEYESWANERLILEYPIAEGFKYDETNPVWPSGTEYFIRVSGYAKRKGFLWFYVNACCRNENTGQWKWDPEELLLDIDQRDEPVYCGIIEVSA